MADIYLETLERHWGHREFRGVQREIIESVAAGHDTLGLMPTGGGKSVTFQVPTLSGEGMCLVVTPLVALMKDQVLSLRRKGVKATAVYNGMTLDEISVALDNCILGGYKFLYVSPERLATELFLCKVRRMPVSLITVDEAHCISQWGYDFRPAYLRISDIRKIFPDVPVLALTATATPEVVGDIQLRLDFRKPNVFRMSFERKNLTYVVRHTEDKLGELLHILESCAGSAVVYTRSRKKTTEIARFLKDHGISALNFHAGLTRHDKDLRQSSWTEGETRVMAATNAFGMGIDKPDVRIVVHVEPPDSPEAYFQEAGRAGRDGKRAYAVLLHDPSDKQKLTRRVAQNFPPLATIRQVYDNLAYFFELALGDGHEVTYDFNIVEFCTRYRMFAETVENSLRILTRAGYVFFSEDEEIRSRVVFMTGRDELYRISNISAEGEAVVQALLRNYGGIFVDYSFIDEQFLAERCLMTRERVAELLVGLSHQRIIHYIPRKRTPRVTFLQRRVLSRDLVIGPEVYGLRKEAYAGRIRAMLDYCGDSVCHSRFLLEYFGDSRAADCGRCEICLDRRKRGRNPGRPESVREGIMSLLGDGKPHLASAISVTGHPTPQVAATLAAMVRDGEVVFSDGTYTLGTANQTPTKA